MRPWHWQSVDSDARTLAQGNYAALAHLGPQLEALAGPQRFAVVYGVAAAAATVASLALNGGRRSLGASGAVFGVAAALARYHRWAGSRVCGCG